MSNFSDFIGGGGGGGLPVNIVLGHSQTWVPPVDGNICIHVVGAGGGATGVDNDNYSPTSGGGGGYCKKNSLAVTTSGSFTVVVGAGGEGKVNQAAGTTGGSSTVAGTGLSATLTANGGTGSSISGSGTGGTAANGDVNNTGGAGNYNGGGAVGITTTGIAGGGTAGRASPYGGGHCDVVGPESLMGHGYICGGLGGDLLQTTTTSNTNSGATQYSPNGNGGFLAGGGVAQITGAGINSAVHGGHGGIGGGGGGASNGYAQSRASGGYGGNGIVIIQYLPA